MEDETGREKTKAREVTGEVCKTIRTTDQGERARQQERTNKATRKEQGMRIDKPGALD